VSGGQPASRPASHAQSTWPGLAGLGWSGEGGLGEKRHRVYLWLCRLCAFDAKEEAKKESGRGVLRPALQDVSRGGSSSGLILALALALALGKC